MTFMDSEMTEYELYVPLWIEKGKRHPQGDLRCLKTRLVEKFGGLTHFPQKTKGLWRVGQATFYDDIIILRVLTEQTQATRSFWRKLKKELQRKWKQKHVLIVVRKVAHV